MWAQNPTNPDRPQSPLPPEPQQDQQLDRQNLECYDQYKRKLNRQSNKRANTDTYIPDNSWPRERRQFTLNEV
jgi:hypothetical protein